MFPHITKSDALALVRLERKQEWGATSALARLCGITSSAVQQWRAEQELPELAARRLYDERPGWFQRAGDRTTAPAATAAT